MRSKRNVRSVSTDVQGRNGKARTKECEGHKKERDVGGGGGRKESGRAASVTLYFWQLSGHRFTTDGFGLAPRAICNWIRLLGGTIQHIHGQHAGAALFSTLAENMACRWEGVCGTGGAHG